MITTKIKSLSMACAIGLALKAIQNQLQNKNYQNYDEYATVSSCARK